MSSSVSFYGVSHTSASIAPRVLRNTPSQAMKFNRPVLAPGILGFLVNLAAVLSSFETSQCVQPRTRTNCTTDRKLPANSSKSRKKDKVITILALLDMSDSESTVEDTPKPGQPTPDPAALLSVAQMAVGNINERRILPGFRFELVANDSKCDPGTGVDAFFHAIYTRQAKKQNPFMFLLGPHCSSVTESVAKVTAYWNVIQISYAAKSAVLSDRQKYPLFFRTNAVESTHNEARLHFLKHFKWDSVSIIVQNEDEYTLVVNDLGTNLEAANITVASFLTFAPNDFNDQLETLIDKDARIVVANFSPRTAVAFLCEIYHRNLYGSDHVWILPDFVIDLSSSNQQVTKTNASCRPHELARVTEGSFYFRAYSSPFDNSSEQLNYTLQGPSERLPKFHNEIYDAVWALALALGEMKQESDGFSDIVSSFNYDKKEITYALADKISSLKFRGSSGLVSFAGGDRIGVTGIYQSQNGTGRLIALFHPDSGFDLNCPDCVAVRWPTGQIPVATRIIKLRVNTIDPVAFFSVAFVALLGIVLAICCLTFNLAKRKLKVIKLSSPKLNNIAVVGAILVYAAVVLLGIDHATIVHESIFPAVCMGRAYLLSAGFSLSFGAMFTKTFRVHRIFSRRNSLVKNKLLADTQLIGLIITLLALDTLIIAVWVAVDPMERYLHNVSLEVSPVDRTVAYQSQIEVCKSEYSFMWLGIVYMYKGLLLIVGVYMAWETRNVAIPALNDSPYIGMNVYNVVITSVIVVVCDRLLAERTTLVYVVVATLVLTSTTTALCLLFLPKFHAVWRHAEKDPIAQSTGLKVEFNTRRMVTDDRKELLYRAEVLHRVYTREIDQIDTEITRIERLLSREDVPTAFCTEALQKYNCAIQAEVTQLYAFLDDDESSLLSRGALQRDGDTVCRYRQEGIAKNPAALRDSLELDDIIVLADDESRTSSVISFVQMDLNAEDASMMTQSSSIYRLLDTSLLTGQSKHDKSHKWSSQTKIAFTIQI